MRPDPRADLVGEVRRRRPDERVDVVDRRLDAGLDEPACDGALAALTGSSRRSRVFPVSLARRAAPASCRRPAARHRALLELQLHGRQVRAHARVGAARLLVGALRDRRGDLLRRSPRARADAPRRSAATSASLLVAAALGIWLNQVIVRLLGAPDDRGDRRAHVRDAADLRRARRAARSASSGCTPAPLARRGRLVLRRRARGGGGVERSFRRPRRHPARPRRRGDLGRVLGGDGPAHAALLAVPDQRLRAPRRLRPARRSRRLADSPSRTGRRSAALAWACFVYSLFFSLVFTNIMWFTAIDRVGAARASLYANLQPFLGAFFALVVLSEEMSGLQFVGGVVIAAGS